MKRKEITAKILAMTLSAGMLLGSTSFAAERKDAEAIKEDNMAVEETVDVQAEAGEQQKKTEYPVTITTYGSDGAELETTYEKAPEKVLAVYQGCIETLLELGLEDHIAATAGLDNEVPDHQKAAFSKTNYLEEFTPSLETVTMLEPDMIFSWGSLFKEKTLGDAMGWVEKGTNIYMNSNTRPKSGDLSYDRTLENEYTDILNMGIIFDVQDKAEAIVNDMKDTIEKVKEAASGVENKPTVLILESWDDSYSNYGASSLGGDMVTQLGGVLSSPDGGSLGKEDVVVANPDVLFVVYMPYSGDDPEAVKEEKLSVFLEDEAFQSLDAVKNGRVVPIMLSEMYASATCTKDGIVTFAEGLYPDLDLELE